jgi:hypothetical protein
VQPKVNRTNEPITLTYDPKIGYTFHGIWSGDTELTTPLKYAKYAKATITGLLGRDNKFADAIVAEARWAYRWGETQGVQLPSPSKAAAYFHNRRTPK